MNPHHYWRVAEAASDRRDWQASKRAYGQALELDPAHVPSLIGLSSVLGRSGDYRNSHAAAMKAWECRPEDPALIFGLAQRLRAFSEFAALEDCWAAPQVAREAPIQAIAKAVADWVPLAFAAFEDYRMGGTTLSAKGIAVLKRRLAGETVSYEDSGMSKGEWREFEVVWG